MALARHRLGAILGRPDARALAEGPLPSRTWVPGDFLPPGSRPQDRDALLQGRFRFLSRTEQVGWPPRWDDPDLSRLWAYNLHYFEYLWDLDFSAACEVAEDWIARHEPGPGRTGWEPYPTSLRLVNWTAYFFGRHAAALAAEPDLERRLIASITAQADHLAAHLERHLLGNHLFENALALAFCGACFDGPAGSRWLRAGIELLEAQLAEQVLADGGHFERSPMYHVRIAYGLRCLRDTGHPELVALVSEPLDRMVAALGRLCHPDGEIALLNDAAFGIYNAPSDLGAVSVEGSFALPDTGYFGAATRSGHYVVCDAAPIGPDYLPGHAHADMLSFELSFAGHRVIVDAGVYGYEVDELRRWCRSTHAHNTVEIDGEDQCEMWSAFRVARRGWPRDVRFTSHEGGFSLDAWHDGYRRLPGRPVHRRRFRWHDEGVLMVRDDVEANASVVARSRLHLHPSCEVLELGADAARLRYPGGEFRICFAEEGTLEREASTYHPEFGLCEESTALVFTPKAARSAFGFCISNGSGAPSWSLSSGVSLDGRSFAW